MIQRSILQLKAFRRLQTEGKKTGYCKEKQVGPHEIPTSTDLDNVDHTLSITGCEKDLGIWITSTLCSSLQCQKAYAKAMQSLATAKCSFKYITKESFKILYKTYIRLHIEYCVQAWSPYYAKDIDMLEKIQHHATKLIPQLANLPYEERIQNLNMYSLYCRRERGDLIETFKILKQQLLINSAKLFTLYHQLLSQEDTTLNFLNLDPDRSKFFTDRIINEWNILPLNVINAQSVNDFKNKLDTFWTATGYGHRQEANGLVINFIINVFMS